MRGLPSIARNTSFLIFRQGLVAAADLLAVRLILNAVGVEGQGICAMVVEWVAVFSCFTGTLRAAFQRFLSAEIGKGAEGDVRQAFAVALLLTLSGGLLVLLIGETFGLWGLTRFLAFPDGRHGDVLAVYQAVLAGVAVSYLTLPFQALAVARERMGILAGCGIVESATLLGVAVLLNALPDAVRLPVCSTSGLLITVLSLTYLRVRMRDLPEVRTMPVFARERARAILSYFGWSIMGSFANMVRLSGTQTLLNRRAGVAFNSSWSVAYRVGSFLYVLVSSVQQAIEPQLVKRLEGGAREEFLTLTFRSERWLFTLVWIIAFPVLVFTPELVGWWLGDVQPPQIVPFVRVFVLYFLFAALSAPFHSAIMASVSIGRFQSVLSVLCVTGFVAVAVALFGGAPAWCAAACVAAANVLGFAYRLFHFCRTESVPFQLLARKTLLPIAALVAASFLILSFR